VAGAGRAARAVGVGGGTQPLRPRSWRGDEAARGPRRRRKAAPTRPDPTRPGPSAHAALRRGGARSRQRAARRVRTLTCRRTLGSRSRSRCSVPPVGPCPRGRPRPADRFRPHAHHPRAGGRSDRCRWTGDRARGAARPHAGPGAPAGGGPNERQRANSMREVGGRQPPAILLARSERGPRPGPRGAGPGVERPRRNALHCRVRSRAIRARRTEGVPLRGGAAVFENSTACAHHAGRVPCDVPRSDLSVRAGRKPRHVRGRPVYGSLIAVMTPSL
jgi:hypothetical protein